MKNDHEVDTERYLTMPKKPVRTFKYRAWSKKSKEMLYNVGILPNKIGNTWVIGSDGLLINPTSPVAQERFEVMEFVRMTDRKRKEMYEGDIVRVFYYENGRLAETRDEEIVATKAGWDLKHCRVGESLATAEVEVIGNVYETPELLK